MNAIKQRQEEMLAKLARMHEVKERPELMNAEERKYFTPSDQVSKVSKVEVTPYLQLPTNEDLR